jgi:ribose transport system ATP-binding protein
MVKDTVLTMQGITKRFPGVTALRSVDFEVHPGEIHALVGHNGAGKSTLLKILAGVYRADEGQIVLNGQEITRWGPQQVLDHGVSFIYQELNLVQSMSVAQNIMIGREPRRAAALVDWRSMCVRAENALAHIAAGDIDVRAPVGELGVAKQQLVAIARALDQHPTLLVLDEPTSRLSLEDTQHLFDLLDQMRDQGLSIIYVSHRLDEIYRIADRVTVLRDGERVLTAEIGDVSPDELVQHMIGSAVEAAARQRALSQGERLLFVDDLTGPGVHGVSFALHSGEVLGIVGAVGAGKTELVRLLFGIDLLESGEIVMRDGTPLHAYHPSAAIAHGLALCPEDRKEQGLLLDSSIRENITLAGLRDLVVARWFPSRRKESSVVNKLVKRLRIVTPTINQHARALSGGNQQKVVLAKWLCTDSQIFILDEPTVGVDVQGKVEIYELMYELAEQGAGILFVTSDIEEGLQVCDRLVVVYRGEIAADLMPAQTKLEDVMLYAMGGHPNGSH